MASRNMWVKLPQRRLGLDWHADNEPMSQVAHPAVDVAAAEASARRVRVLLADPAPGSRTTLRHLLGELEDFTAEVQEIATIADLRHAWSSEQFEVHLIDQRLAADAGVDALMLPTHAPRPVVLVIGDGGDDRMDEALQAVATAYLTRGPALTSAMLDRTITGGLRRAADQHALFEQARRLANAQALAGVGSWEWHVARDEITWSEQLFRNFGLDPQSAAPNFEGYTQLLHPDDRDAAIATIQRAMQSGERYRLEHRVVWPDGQVRMLHCTGEVLTDEDAQPVLLRGTAQLASDIATDEPTDATSERFRAAFDEAPIGMALITRDGGFLQVNRSLCALAGRSRQELLGGELPSIVHGDDATASQAQLAELADGLSDQCSFEARLKGADGADAWTHVTAARIGTSIGDAAVILAHVVDIADRREREQHWRDLADRDPLTGVPNRRAWDVQLADTMARARADDGKLALALLDLNSFKTLNDRHGHEAGDALLKASALAWQGELRGGDTLARLGGDEFAVLLEHCANLDVEAVGERLRLATPHDAGCAVGIAVWDGAETADELVRRADEALYADKSGARRARLGDPERVAAVHATGLFGAPAAAELDRITGMAAWLLKIPISFVSLVTADQLHFAGHSGLPAAVDEHPTVPVAFSFCQHTVTAGRTLLIGDARTNPLVCDNPLVEHMNVIAYAGIPLTDDDGHVLGALCAVDHRPREWTPQEIATLELLAERVTPCLQAG